MLLRSASLLAVVAAVGLMAACPPKAADGTLPPAGLAGAPGAAAPTAINPNAAMPAGHPPIDGAHAMNGGGGDDGAPIPTKPGELALPNLPGMGTPQGGGGGGGAGVVFTAKVLEKFDVPSYTYMRVQVGGTTEEWVAVSTMPVNVGDTITVNQQIVMENFPSKSLNRTFPRLIMGSASVGG